MADWQVDEGMDEMVVQFTDPRPSRWVAIVVIGGFFSTFLFFGLQLAGLGMMGCLAMSVGTLGLLVLDMGTSPRVTLRITATALDVSQFVPWRRTITGPLDTVAIAIQPHNAADSTATLRVAGHTVRTGPHPHAVLEAFAAQLEQRSQAARDRLGDLEQEVPPGLRSMTRRSDETV